jgi:hypothetical protein
MTEPGPHDDRRLGVDSGEPWWQPRSLLTPQSAAIAAFAVAVLTLNGQNLLVVGVQSLLGQGFWNGGPAAGYYVAWGLAALVPVLAVGWLARLTLRSVRSGWEASLARAACIVVVLALVGAVLTAVGGIIHGSM